MIVEKSNDIQQFGTLQGEKVAMGFAADATGHLMDVLAKNLYSRPKEAALREYSTNALDAQIEIGETRPIEVTLPTALSPVLRIRDFGVGLDMEGIRKVYSQYGASTKRETNDLNGTLGLGGKSAFAYTNRFTVVSIKNGKRIEVAVTRNEDGTADMVVVDERPTDEPRGTEIKIPTKRGDDFFSEARSIYYWFPKGSVLVNGLPAAHFDATDECYLKLSDSMFIEKATSYVFGNFPDLVVMGNIAYPVETIKTGLDKQQRLIVFVPNGAVQFAPSREALLLNGFTRKHLAKVQADYEAALITTMQASIDACTTRWDAADVVARWGEVIPANVTPASGWKYKGEGIPMKLTLAHGERNAFTINLVKSGYHNSHAKRRELSAHWFKNTLWVDGFTPDSLTSSHAKKARKYVADKAIDASRGIVFMETIPADKKPWIQNVISYDDLKAVKLPRNATQSTASGRIPGSYDVRTTESSVIDARYGPGSNRDSVMRVGVPAEEFRHWKAPLFFYAGNVHDATDLFRALRYVQGVKGCTLVCMRADRVAKFQRNFPAAQNARDAVTAGFKAWEATLSAEDLKALAIQDAYWTANNLRALYSAEKKLKDPQAVEAIKLANRDLTKLNEKVTMFRQAIGKTPTLPMGKAFDFSDRYPLFDRNNMAHSIFYCNAVYDARQSGATL